ncbi:damage-inducible protein CinA [Planctomycetales bacterium]|nr:damage-inducible protein CinA [Planctomycetales bacterium]
MYAEIISNGDEIASGKILDTNSQWLSRELADLGITVLYHTTVGDDLQAMVDVLRIAEQRADLIIWTGGLGPTADDLTRQAVADSINVPLVKDEKSLEQIKEMFKRRGREMPPSNGIQAFFPKGAVPIFNPHGTAPGIDLTVKRAAPAVNRPDFYRFMAFPGVPAELKEMWKDSARQSLLDMLEKISGGSDGLQRRVLRFRSINSFGLGESQTEAKLPGLVDRTHYPKVGITATQGTITLRIAAEGKSEEECFRLMEPAVKQIYDALGTLIFSEGDETMQDVVCKVLAEKKKTAAVIEAGTRGLLSEALSSAVNKNPAAKQCFAGSVILPNDSGLTAEKMVSIGKQWKELTGKEIDYLLLVGPYPDGQPDRDRKEETFLALVDFSGGGNKDNNFGGNIQRKDFIAYEVYPYVGHPDIIDDLHIKRTLNLLRHILETIT